MFEGQKKEPPEEGRTEEGKFLPGNKFWRNQGRKRIYSDPDEFLEACYLYFDWVDDNPLWVMKVFGTGLEAKIPHPRAMTLRGLCAHIGMATRTWADYKARPEFKEICETVEDVIFDQKFAGAAAGLFSAVIIARDLGLADKSEADTSLTIEVVDSYADDQDT